MTWLKTNWFMVLDVDFVYDLLCLFGKAFNWKTCNFLFQSSCISVVLLANTKQNILSLLCLILNLICRVLSFLNVINIAIICKHPIIGFGMPSFAYQKMCTWKFRWWRSLEAVSTRSTTWAAKHAHYDASEISESVEGGNVQRTGNLVNSLKKF